MAKLMRNMLLMAKIQPVANTDAAPVPATNAMLARGIAPQPVQAEFADRALVKPYFGHTGQIQVQVYSVIEFEVELAGAGAAGTVPKYGALLRACGFSETVSAAVKVDYAPITSAQEAVTIHCYLDGIKHAMTDCKGTVSFQLSAKGIPVMRYIFTGYHVAATDTANPAGADYAGFIPPLAVNKQNTPTFTLHSAAVKATQLSIDMANEINYRNYIGAESIAFTNRLPVGQATFEYDTIATKDWWTIAKNGTLNPLSLVHGITAGNIVQIDAPKVQILSPSLSDDTGIAMLNVSLALQPNTGNDEILISVK